MNGTINDIIAKYDETIEKTISLYKVRARQYGLDLDDFRQICRITIWNCLKYKKESDPDFVPYIKVSMRKAIRSYILRDTTGFSRQAYDKYSTGKYKNIADLSIKTCSDLELMWRTVTDDLSFTDNSIDTFIHICNKKDPVLGEILKLRIAGYTRENITNKAHISGRTYDRRIAAIKNMYRAYFEENENDIEKQRSGKARPAIPH